jgi:acyl carrier protein
MADQDKLTAEVVAIVAGIAEVDAREVSPTARLEDLGIDSLDGLRIVAAVEKRYSIVIDEARIAGIRSMPDIVALIREFASEVP